MDIDESPSSSPNTVSVWYQVEGRNSSKLKGFQGQDVDDLRKNIKKESELDVPADALALYVKDPDSGQEVKLDERLRKEHGDFRNLVSYYGINDESPIIVRLLSESDDRVKRLRIAGPVNIFGALANVGLTEKARAGGLPGLTFEEKAKVFKQLGDELLPNDNFNAILAAASHFKNHDGTKMLTSASGVSFPVVDQPQLYVRQAYKELHEIILNDFTIVSRAILTGTSGIGKSTFLVYLTIMLLAADPPNIVIFQTGDSANQGYYCFVGTLFCRRGSLDAFANILDSSDTWYLADGIKKPFLVKAKTLAALSSKGILDNEFQEFAKRCTTRYYMPPWSLEELKHCRDEIFSELDVDFMENIYKKTGGVPRFVLQLAAEGKNTNPNDRNAAEETALARFDQAINTVKDIPQLLSCIRQGKEYIAYSSRLIHRWPQANNFRKCEIKWASRYVADWILEALKDHIWTEALWRLADTENRGGTRGFLFETYVEHVFRTGGHSFEIKALNSTTAAASSQSTLTLAKPEIKHVQDETELSRCLKPGELIVPSVPNFPAVDFLMTPTTLFQVTVSENHPVKQHELGNIIENMPAYKANHNTKFRLYFVVPEDIFDNFQRQNYVKSDKTVAKNKDSRLHHVEQWALKINIESDIARG